MTNLIESLKQYFPHQEIIRAFSVFNPKVHGDDSLYDAQQDVQVLFDHYNEILEANETETLKEELREFKFELLESYSHFPMSKVSKLGKKTQNATTSTELLSSTWNC